MQGSRTVGESASLEAGGKYGVMVMGVGVEKLVQGKRTGKGLCRCQMFFFACVLAHCLPACSFNADSSSAIVQISTPRSPLYRPSATPCPTERIAQNSRHSTLCARWIVNFRACCRSHSMAKALCTKTNSSLANTVAAGNRIYVADRKWYLGVLGSIRY